MRAVVDPGVLVAALISPVGAPAHVVRMARDRIVDLVVSPHLLAELTEVLHRPRFRRYFELDEADEYVQGLARLAITVGDPLGQDRITRDSDDDYLVRLARAAGADALVSGDRDLLDAPVADVVLTPAELVERGRTL